MKNIMTILIALSIICAFSIVGWAQPENPEDDPQPSPSGTEAAAAATAATGASSDQATAAQDEQGAMLQPQQATVTASMFQIDGCKLKSVVVGAKDQVTVETTYKDAANQVYSNVISDFNNDGYVDKFNDNTANSMDDDTKTTAYNQFDYANRQLSNTVGEVVTAFNTQAFVKGETGEMPEQCNQLITPEGVVIKVNAIMVRGENNNPIPLAYKLTKTVNGNSFVSEISPKSIFGEGLRGLLRAIYRNGACPVSKWIEVREMGAQALPVKGTQALPTD